MKIAVIGTGYVGLVSATCFAESGNDVIGIDKDERKIATLHSGKLPIYEPGLLELVQRNTREGRLHFTTDLAEGILPAKVILLAVGTPQSAEGAADLSALWAVADAIAGVLKKNPEAAKGKVIITKSTVPVGTCKKLTDRLAKAGCPAGVDVASNPEFLKEGAALDDFMKPDRVVVGVRRPEVAEVLREAYAPFLRTERPFLVMTPESAEMTKYAANAMLATKISFINEMANLCDALGADINDVRRGIGHDQRIGFQFLFPGPGYGGSCFDGAETLFVRDAAGVSTLSFANFAAVAERAPAVAAWHIDPERQTAPVRVAGAAATEGVAMLAESPAWQVLAFDVDGGEPTWADVRAVTRRPYRGAMVRLTTTMGRTVQVTADHPVIRLAAAGEEVVRADAIQVGDRLPALCELPAGAAPASLDLIELLAGSDLEADVHVGCPGGDFADQYRRFAPHIRADELRHPLEIKWNHRMPLRLFRRLRDLGVLDVPPERLQLYTAKGAATKLNAVIPVDGDLLRLCGYYLAEGFVSRDTGRAGAVRERVGFCFHANETEYTADVQRILARWGLKFLERPGQNALTTLVSSRVFAWLVRDVLGCGTRSEDKAVPRLAFDVAPELRHELVRRAFSGDGAVTPVQNGRNLMLEYATVSRRLADGMAVLLQSLGIVPSIRRRWMNKSKRPAFLVRVSGRDQIAALGDVFGGKHRDRIAGILAGYQRTIRQRGFDRRGALAALTVRSIEFLEVVMPVFSVETATGTVVAASGLVCHNCFPKDVRALVALAGQHELPLHLMRSVDSVNEAQKQVLVREHFGDRLAGRTLAVWGLAFKPRTDDIREAPALTLIDAMLAAGVACRVHDPEAIANVRAIYGDKLIYCDRPYGAVEGADGLVIVTEWQEFRNPDFEVLKRLMKEKVIFDGRNLYDPKQMATLGFTYHGMGRGRA